MTQPRCIVREAVRGARRVPLLFVHGAFTGAWCWDEHFLPYFAARGHDAWAVDLRGHGDDAAPVELASIEDYVADLVLAIEQIGEPPVIVGHDGVDIPACLRPHEWTKPTEEVSAQRAMYAGMITFIDEQVGRIIEAIERKGAGIPVVFGVFFYRSANPRTLETLGGFFPVPADEISRDFAAGVDAEEICARTVRELRRVGADKIYVSNLGNRGAGATLRRILERV